MGGAGAGARRHRRRHSWRAGARSAFRSRSALAAIAAGFATATLKTARIAHPVLQSPASSVTLAGFVEIREERERSDRIVVRVHQHRGPRASTRRPSACGVAVRKGTAPAVGSFVEFKARLSPPLAPLRPGGYDFARDMYFQRIGASGFALGAIKTVAPPVAPGLWLRYAAFIDGMREAIDKRIRAVRAGRPRLDRVGADHRQARRDFDAGQRRDVHLEPRACAVDLRLSHGGGGGHRVLFHSRRRWR